jgi:hypothetical protein
MPPLTSVLRLIDTTSDITQSTTPGNSGQPSAKK